MGLDWLTRDPNATGKSLPEWFRLGMVFIDRIGFPISAFIIMTALSFFLLWKMVPVLESINKNLTEMNIRLSSR